MSTESEAIGPLFNGNDWSLVADDDTLTLNYPPNMITSAAGTGAAGTGSVSEQSSISFPKGSTTMNLGINTFELSLDNEFCLQANFGIYQ